MDYGQLISRAWYYTKRYRFLWWLGLLAMFTEGGSFGSNFGNLGNLPSSSTPNNTPTPVPNTSTTSFIQRIPRVLGTSTTDPLANAFDYIHQFIILNWVFLLIIFFLSIIVVFGVLYISYSAKAGLILSVDTLEKSEQPLGFRPAYRAGRHFAWRLFGLNMLIGLIIFLMLLVFAAPTLILLTINQSTITVIIAVLIGLIALIAFVIGIIYFSLVVKLAERILVLHDSRIVKSLEDGRVLFRHQRSHVLITWLIPMALAIAAGLVILLGLLIVGAILFGIGLAVYVVANSVGAIIYGIIAGLALIAALLVTQGAFTAFVSAYWTLSYRAMEYLTNHQTDQSTNNHSAGLQHPAE